jgi:hypothetical protein
METANPFTNESTIDVDIPGLGAANVTAGVAHFMVRFESLVLFGKNYRETIDISTDGTPRINQFTSLTAAASRRAEELLAAWGADWVQTSEARNLLAATVAHHNRISESIVREEIVKATNHLRELEMIAERFRAIDDPCEYVSRYDTMYRLIDNKN